MPEIQLSDLVPSYPLHWTTILHYLALLSVIAILTAARDKATVLFTLVLAVLALALGADLYSNLLRISRIFIFLLRVVIFALPIVIAGMAPTGESRSLGFLAAILGLPFLVLTFLTCILGPAMGDPRIWQWCG